MRTINRGLLVLIFVLAVTGVWFVATSGNDVGLAKEMPAAVKGQSAVAPVPINPIDPVGGSIFQCYSVSGGVPHFRNARLFTQNFGGDVVSIIKMVAMCEQATKTDPTGVVFGEFTDPVIMACFQMVKGTNPDDPVELTTGNFGAEQVDVGQAVAMCEGASKMIPGALPVGIPGDHIWEIFSIGNGDDPFAPFVLETKNFGPDDVTIRQAGLMFEEAVKETALATDPILGVASGRVWECYKLEGGDNPDKNVTLRTINFGEEQVIVGPAIIMCEEARKRPILVPDDPIG